MAGNYIKSNGRIDFRGGGHRPKLSRKQQITQLSCDSMCETDDETAEGGGGKDSIAPSEGRLLAHINIII